MVKGYPSVKMIFVHYKIEMFTTKFDTVKMFSECYVSEAKLLKTSKKTCCFTKYTEYEQCKYKPVSKSSDTFIPLWNKGLIHIIWFLLITINHVVYSPNNLIHDLFLYLSLE
jgi:hypothetical protein